MSSEQQTPSEQKYEVPAEEQEKNDAEKPIVSVVDTTKVEEEHDSKSNSKSKMGWAKSRRENDIYEGYDQEMLEQTLPIEFLEQKFTHYVRDGKLRRELAVFAPFLVLFLVFSLSDMDIQQTHFGLSAIRKTWIEKFIPNEFVQRDMIETQRVAGDPINNDRTDMTFMSIESAEHWHDWFNTLVGEVYQCGDVSKNGASTAPNANYTLSTLPKAFKGQLIPVGAMRITTKRVKEASCPISNDVVVDSVNYPSRFALTDTRCWAKHKNAVEETISPRCNLNNPFKNESLWQYKLCGSVPGSYTTTDQGVYDCSGYMVEVPWTASCAQVLALQQLMKIDSCQFIDDVATRFVIVEGFYYSVNLDVHFSAKVIAELTSGGAWLPTHQFRAFIVQSTGRLWKVIIDFFFLVYVFYYIVVFFTNLKAYYLEEGLILRYFANFWTFVEMINVVCYLAVFILRWMWWAESNSAKTQFPFPDDKYPDFDRTLILYSQMRYALAFNFILTFIKVLKFLKMSNKLNVIAKTFENSQADVLGLLFLFTMIVTAYALAGTSLFGPLMREFSSVDRSFSSLMQMILGVMDYDSMKAVNRGLAGFYFWSYLVISFFLILNFIVAVVGEAFTQAGQAEFSPPLAESILMLIDEFIYTLRPRNLKNRIVLAVKHKKSTNFLHGQILTYISQLTVTKQLQNPTAMENMVTPREILKFLPNNLRREYQPFFAHEWEVVSKEFELMMNSDEQRLEIARQQAVREGIQMGLSGREPGKVFDESITRTDIVVDLGNKAIVGLAKKYGIDINQSFGVRPGTREGRRSSNANALNGSSSPNHSAFGDRQHSIVE